MPDQDLWIPALAKHQELFGHPPRLAVADGGFASAANEGAATELGVTHVALPRNRGRFAAPAAKPKRDGSETSGDRKVERRKRANLPGTGHRASSAPNLAPDDLVEPKNSSG